MNAQDDKPICDKCGYAPLDYNFHKACHDYLEGKITSEDYQQALTSEEV